MVLLDSFPPGQNPYADPAPGVQPSSTPIHEPLSEQGQAETEELAERQAYVDRLLSRGVIFSIFWVFGLGSFYSLFLAWKAHRIIRESEGRLYGLGSVLFCYILGGLGTSLFAGVLTAIFGNASRI